jgi:choline dehydrogenase-like flavoprotein
MLSGIGDTNDLRSYGIDVLKHLPAVGRSLKDHPAVFLTALMKPGFTARVAFETDSEAQTVATAQWNEDGTGRLSSEFQSNVVMFNRVPELYKTPEFVALPKNVRNYIMRETVPTYEVIFGGPKFPPNAEIPTGQEYLGITVVGMIPQGEGLVKLVSADPSDAVSIDPKALSHPFDRKLLIESILDTLKIFRNTRQYQNGFISWLNGPKSETREDIETFIDEQVILIWHANGTAKMGRQEDEDAVVDTSFRVRGVAGLRVVDLSVCPVTIK